MRECHFLFFATPLTRECDFRAFRFAGSGSIFIPAYVSRCLRLCVPGRFPSEPTFLDVPGLPRGGQNLQKSYGFHSSLRSSMFQVVPILIFSCIFHFSLRFSMSQACFFTSEGSKFFVRILFLSKSKEIHAFWAFEAPCAHYLPTFTRQVPICTPTYMCTYMYTVMYTHICTNLCTHIHVHTYVTDM